MVSQNNIPAVAFLYHAMALSSDIMVLFDETNPLHYRLFNITSVAADVNRQLPSFVGPSETFGRFRIAQAPGGGYFDVVSVPYAVPANKQDFFDINFRWLQSPWLARRQHLLLDFGGAPVGLLRLQPNDPLPVLAVQGEAGRVESSERNNETYRAVVNLDRPAYALFKMTFHPNWRAAVDHKIRPTVMLSPGFLGVPVEAGTHDIEFWYEPGTMKSILLVAGVLTLVGLVAAERSQATERLLKRFGVRPLAARRQTYSCSDSGQ